MLMNSGVWDFKNGYFESGKDSLGWAKPALVRLYGTGTCESAGMSEGDSRQLRSSFKPASPNEINS